MRNGVQTSLKGLYAGDGDVRRALERGERVEQLRAAALDGVADDLLDVVGRLPQHLAKLRSGLSHALQYLSQLALAPDKIGADKLKLIRQRTLRYLFQSRLFYLFKAFQKAVVFTLRPLRSIIFPHKSCLLQTALLRRAG